MLTILLPPARIIQSQAENFPFPAIWYTYCIKEGCLISQHQQQCAKEPMADLYNKVHILIGTKTTHSDGKTISPSSTTGLLSALDRPGANLQEDDPW
jgi:hypothetical protein